MISFAAHVGVAVILFVWTNVDDLLVLLGFFSNPAYRARHVVIGQYLGIGVLYGVSVLVSLLCIVVPPVYLGLLGLVPIFMGVRILLFRPEPRINGVRRGGEAVAAVKSGKNILAVATVTVANGGDNISIYTPLFATRPAPEVAVAGLVFAMMTGLWCLLGHWLVHHPALGAPIRRYGHRTLPFILIGFGILILYEGGALKFI